MKQKLLFQVLLLCCSFFLSWAVNAADYLNLDNAGVVTYTELSSTIVTISGKTELHITGSTPLINSTVDMQSDDSWLYLDAVKPSAAIEKYIKTKAVTINGKSIVLKLGTDNDNANQNARIAVYKQGSVIIPNGNLSDNNALQVFTGPDFGGNSKFYPIYTRHTSLGTFNNAIKSFKLKKGYMATMANHVDGTGFSKVFIADASDLEMNAMPKGLEGTVSFIRVMRWDWVSQKGWSGGGNPVDLTNSTSFYAWNASEDTSSPDKNYVPAKVKITWPSLSEIQEKKNVNHVLFYNEPEHPEQHKDDNGEKAITVEQAINAWPGMMASGLRLGSPAPTDFSWLYNFISECNKRNYRVDFVAVHSYWWTSMSSWRSQLQAVWNNTGRPVWVTEWNNGANWTGNDFPDKTGLQCDADGNTLPNATTVNLPSSPANIAKQVNDIKNIVNIMEEPALHIERYFIYNWVQDARALELSGKLTPAGKWYAANPSKLAFTGEYDHKWKLVIPDFTCKVSATNSSQYIFSWKDYNRETAIGYVLEKYTTGSSWVSVGDVISAIRTDAGASSDGAVPVITATDILTESAYYRVKAIGYDGSTVNSSVVTVTLDALAPSPVVKATPVSAVKINLEWNTVVGATGYRIYKASYPDSIYTVLRNSYTSTSYDDDWGLTPNTIYWYRVHSLNNRGESADAVPVKVITNKENGEPGDGGLSIDKVTVTDFRFYPNPAKAGEKLFVENENFTGEFSMEILDMTGKTVLQFSDNKSVYAPQTKGIYFIRVITQQKTGIGKLIVK